MASVLEKLPASEARNVLMALIKRLTPQPYDAGEPQAASDELLREFQRRVGVNPGDMSNPAIAKVLDLVRSELTHRLLDKESEAGARERLGYRGELPESHYTPQFGRGFAEPERWGLTKSRVIDAIRRPDLVQHLRAPASMDADSNASIYIQRAKRSELRRNRRDDSALLVQCVRKGSTLIVPATVWRVFYADIPGIQDSGAPINWLEAFANTYGLSFFINDKGPFKFITYEVFPHTGNGLQLINPKGNAHIGNFVWKVNRLHLTEVFLTYVIDTTLYEQHLQSHGIRVKPHTDEFKWFDFK